MRSPSFASRPRTAGPTCGSVSTPAASASGRGALRGRGQRRRWVHAGEADREPGLVARWAPGPSIGPAARSPARWSGGRQPHDRLEPAAGGVARARSCRRRPRRAAARSRGRARSRRRRACPPEAVEGARLLLGASAPGPVGDAELDQLPARATATVDDRAARGVPERVRDEVVDHLRDAVAADARRHRARRDELEPRPSRRRPPGLEPPRATSARGRLSPPERCPRRPGRARAARRRGRRGGRPPPPRRPRLDAAARRRRAARGSRAASRSAVSGVRSSCEASATNACCTETSPSTRATMSLNSSASRRSSGGRVRHGRARREVARARLGRRLLEPLERPPDPAGEAEADQRRRPRARRRRSRRARASSSARAGRAPRSGR